MILVALGLVVSLRHGGQLHDWYFLCYESIFLLWPWGYRDRFFFPVVPLACLYLWCGARGLRNFSIQRRRAAGMTLATLGVFLSLCSAAFALRIATFVVNTEHTRADDLQPVFATLFWGTLAVLGFGTFLFRSRIDSVYGPAGLARITQSVASKSRTLSQYTLYILIGILVISGTRQILAKGRQNLKPDMTELFFRPEMDASNWIRTHDSSERALMSREPEFVSHYTHRHVVWLPPISDPKVLVNGIRRYHVGLIVVAHHARSYWYPSEEACFQAFLREYPEDFHLSLHGPDYWIYEVVIPLGA